MSFRWKMGDYAGGSTAVHQGYKPYLCVKADAWASGEFLVQPRDANVIEFNLGFQPDVVFLIGYRPKYANGGTDSAFGARGGGMTFGVKGADGQFTGSSRIRHAFEPNISYWSEDCCYRVAHDFGATEILKFTATLDADGFTLTPIVNLYDETGYIAYLAMSFTGGCKVGVMTTGDTSIGGFPGQPRGAVFLGTQHIAGQTFRDGYWHHMQGFASDDGNKAAVWGGCKPTSWNWTTERWQNDASILHCLSASSSGLVGAVHEVSGRVTAWVNETSPGAGDGYVSFDWPVYGGQLYRVGYVLIGDSSEAGVLETNWNTRPGGSANIPGTQENLQPTGMSTPDVILMAATNYNFSWSDSDPMNWPRSSGAFWMGGSGGFGWHFAPFSEDGYDAYGVHTYGNAVSERGHYSNSGTQYMRRYILAGQGSNSNPPAYHQHSVNVVANPVIVGTNARYAQRHKSASRALLNPSDNRP